MIALVILGIVAAYAAINYLAWYSTVASVQRMSPREARPWNWRVLVGPFAYYPWLNRREEAARLDRPQAAPDSARMGNTISDRKAAL